MKPLNLDNSPCSPIASNCVIWAGNDIPCINLCKGDTVSDVVYKLATELCTIMDTLNISNYDLSCFNLVECPPQDFESLINFLIKKICELNGITPDVPAPSGNCPDNCIVEVADCLGGGTDTLPNYVNTIANKICELVDQITIINSSINVLQTQVSVLEATVATLSNYTTPEFEIQCDIGTLVSPGTFPINEILEEFINNVWCPMNVALVGAGGSAGDLSTAVASQCVLGTDTALVNQYSSPTTMAIQYAGSWIATPVSVADAIRNIWVALCDVRNIELMQYNVTASNDITVTTTVVGPLTTFNVGRTPKISYYAEATTPVQLSSDPGYVDLTYFQPTGYTTLGYTNTSGATKDFLVHVSYDTNITSIVSNSSDVSNWVDGALVKNGVTTVYSSAGSFNLSAHLFDGPLVGDVVSIGTTEQVLTSPSNNPVEFRFANTNLPRNVAFFKKVTLANGESIELKFRSKGVGEGYLLQAQFYTEEIR